MSNDALSSYLERARIHPTAGRDTRPRDEYSEILREQSAKAASIYMSQAPSPDKIAEADKIARRKGLNPVAVDAELDALTSATQVEDFLSLASSNPRMADWAHSNPREAAAALDDRVALSKVNSAFDPDELGRGWAVKATPEVAPTMLNSLKGVWASLVGGMDQMNSGLQLALGDWLGKPSYVSEASWKASQQQNLREIRAQQDDVARARPAFKTWWGSDLYGATSSFAQMTPALVASVATRSPYPAMMVAGIQTGAPAYGKYRARGGTVREATLGAGIEGGSEALFEMLPMSTLARRFGSGAAGKFAGRYLAEEMATEQLTTLVQDAADTAIANPDKSWNEYWAERPTAARETAVAVLFSSGILGGAHRIAERSSQREELRLRAEAEGHFLDALADGAEGSKLRQRSPDAFRAMLDRLTEGMVHDRLYIPADAVRAYQQSEGFEDNEFWRSHEDEIREAETTGGDFVLPISEAITHLSDSGAWNALREDIRLSPGGFSRAEVRELGDERSIVDQDLEGMVAERTIAPRSSLFAVAYQKLVDAGTAPAVARVQAELVSHRYASRMERLGKSLTGGEFNYVGVHRVLPEKMQAAAKADATDLVINALRIGKPAAGKSGPSLIEWAVQRGGLNDLGGDLKAIGLDQWHRQKPFRRRALRDFNPADTTGGVTGAGDYGLDSTLRAAISEGYFPELAAQSDQAYGQDSPDPQILIDAIADELAGNPRHANPGVPDSIREAAAELEQLLAEAGRDPSAMSDDEIRTFLNRFDSDETAGRAYRSGERGRISFTEDGKAIIQLFRSANTSTFLHESGHLFLEELREDASSEDAPQGLRDDWQAVQAWFAANGHEMTDGDSIPVEAHELWARGFERYLMEGKPPAQGLTKAFETMRSWLIGIYRRVASLKSPITDDIRKVMDRLIATDDEIADVRSEQGLDATFGSPAQAGMSEPEFAAYMDLVASAKSSANSELLGRVIGRLKSAETQRYKDQEAEVRSEVIRAVDMRPPFRALDLVRSSPLNRQWIVDRFGIDAVKLMPAGVPPSVKDGGAHPDTVAEAAGLTSGRELVETLIGLEKRRREMREAGDKRSVREATIESEVDDVMAERYGDPFSTGQIEEEALAAVHNDMQGEVLAAEVRALGRRTGRRPTPYSMAREWARRKVRSGDVKSHLSGAALQQYRRAAAFNARAAFEAVSDGDYLAAFQHKQAQLVNNALVREAREAMRDVEKAVKRLERIAGRRKMDGVSQGYLEQAHALLEEVDLKDRSGRQIDRQESYEAWASAREAEGHTMAVPNSFAATIGKTNWTKLSAENLLGLDDAVKQIIHLGRLKQTLIDNQEQRDHDKVVGEALATIERLPLRKVKSFEDPTKWDSIKSGALGAAASLLKMEQVFKRLDGGKFGAFNRVVFQPLSQAQAQEHAMMKKVLGELDAHMRALPKSTVSSWNDQIEIEELYDPRTRAPMKGPRSRLISIALNFGNESNAEKLTRGYGWDPVRVQDVLNKHLSAEEWRYVQNVWDTTDSLWPQVESLERRVNGIVPDKIRARTLSTPAGVLRGGYFPVVYDPGRSRAASQHAGMSADRLFEDNYSRPGTSRGFTKERQQVERPILLSLDVINRHVAEVIHDLTHREAVMQGWRFLSDKRVLDAVDETMGKHISGLFRPWLQHVANEWSYDRAGVGDLEKFMRAARRNTTFVGMAYRIGTMISQVGGYVQSIERIGPKWLAVGLNASLRNPKAANAFAMERSHELPSRFEQFDRDVRENALRYAGKTDFASLAHRYEFSGIGAFDKLVAVPTWLGAYNKAIAAGMEETQAIHEADAAVRESQGSGAAKDLAAIQRGRGPSGELGKALTMFYSFQSANYNRMVDLAWDAGDAWRARKPQMIPELAARAMLITLIAPVLGAILSGQGPDEDNEEGWAEWALKQSVFNIAAPIPFLRDVVPVAVKRIAGDRSFGYRFTPMAGVGESIANVAGDARKIYEGKETKRATRNALEAAGYITGLVPGQGAASAQFFVDVMSGTAEPKSAKDWWDGVKTGKIEEQR